MSDKIAIVGAGLIGRLLAWQLLKHRCQVDLYDRDQGDASQSAAAIAAAMLAPVSEAVDAEPVVYRQGLAALGIWKTWVDELNLTTSIATELNVNGSIVVSHRQDQGDFQRFVQRLRSHADIRNNSFGIINKSQLSQLEPELCENFASACYLEDEGCLDNSALLEALAAAITQRGGRWHYSHQVTHLRADNCMQVFAGVDRIIDCRGFGAREDTQSLRGVRGEVIRVFAPEVYLSRPVRLMHPRYKLYIAPKPGHEYVIGATQIESESEHPVTVRSGLELLSALYSVHTGFSEAEILSQSARCRPAFADNLPAIRQQGEFVSINGLYRHGYLLSPVVIQQALGAMGYSEEQPWPAILSASTRHFNEQQGAA